MEMDLALLHSRKLEETCKSEVSSLIEWTARSVAADVVGLKVPLTTTNWKNGIKYFYITHGFKEESGQVKHLPGKNRWDPFCGCM